MLNLKSNSSSNQKEKGLPLFVCVVCIIFFAWVFSICSIISLSWFCSFEEIVNWKAEKTPYFRDVLIQHDIPLLYNNYLLARSISILLWSIIIGVTCFIFLRRKKLLLCLQQFYDFAIEQRLDCKRAFLRLKTSEKLAFIFLLITSIGLRIYHFSYLPVHVDELMTYYSFVNEGFLLTSLYYPVPNNHVFFNYIFILFSKFINDPILAARIPSAIAFHLMLLMLFFGLLRYFKNYSIAFLSTAMCVFLFPSSVYAAEGRGYAVLSLMVVLAAFSLLLMIEKNRKETTFLFVPACVIGAWTVPVFFIPFLSLVSFGLWRSITDRNRLLFKWIMVSTCCVGVGVFISYLPVFLFSGISAVAANKTVVPVQDSNFFTYIYPIASAEILSFFAGIDTKGWVFFLLFGALALVIYWKGEERYQRWIQLSMLMLGMIFLYALVGRRFMFQRTVTYATYFLYPAVVTILVYATNSTIKSKLVRNVIVGCILICLPFLSYIQYQANVFEVHLLPSKYYNVLEQHISKAIQNEDKVYLAVSDSYVNLYGRYLEETKDMQFVDTLDKANMLIIEESLIGKFTKKELSAFRQTGYSPSLASFLNTLLFYERK
ncbi:hypothetical protein WJR50_24570 [Catalinimonas sp. 4WD22]|uniref:hypothetical protein n=1 Tax=Catalinimonas locisalis TaxID=3133978 RepID=UPI003100DE97